MSMEDFPAKSAELQTVQLGGLMTRDVASYRPHLAYSRRYKRATDCDGGSGKGGGKRISSVVERGGDDRWTGDSVPTEPTYPEAAMLNSNLGEIRATPQSKAEPDFLQNCLFRGPRVKVCFARPPLPDALPSLSNF